MTRLDGFFLIMLFVVVGGALRIMIQDSKLDVWIRKYYNDWRSR